MTSKKIYVLTEDESTSIYSAYLFGPKNAGLKLLQKIARRHNADIIVTPNEAHISVISDLLNKEREACTP